MTERERCPHWLSQDYGWDYVSQVNWDMLRHNLRCHDNVLGNPEKFPKADFEALEEKSLRLHSFLTAHLQM